MAETPNTLMLLLRLGLSLGMVLALVGGITWVLRRRGLLRTTGAGEAPARLQVVDRKSLGKRAQIVVASVGDVTVMLGVTDQQVNVLATAPGEGGSWVRTPTPTDVPDAASIAALTASTAAPSTGGPTDGAVARPTVESILAGTAGHTSRPTPRCSTTPSAPAQGMTTGSRRTGTRVHAQGADTEPTGMSFVDALRELTVRKS